jgi:putative copper resistance protein D
MDQGKSAREEVTQPAEPRKASKAAGFGVAAWWIAAAAVAGLVVAVIHHLSGSGGMHHGQMGEALARAGAEPAGKLFPGKLFTVWQLDAVALVLLILCTAWYLTSVALVGVRHPGTRWPIVRTVLFLAGILTTAYATCGSIAVFDQVLFTAHMAGHLALVMLAPALFVAGRPMRLAVMSSPPARAERLSRIFAGRVIGAITCPPVALATYSVVIVGSHLTGVMDTVMTNTWAGQVEHLVYLLAGMQFFVLIVGDEPIRWHLSAPARWLLLALSMAVDTFTGVTLMLQSTPIDMKQVPGVSVVPLNDTHTGGAIMWFFGDSLMAVVMIVLVIGWLRHVDDVDAGEKGWLEQARQATFAERAAELGIADAEQVDVDTDDAARVAYNAWLEKLNSQH